MRLLRQEADAIAASLTDMSAEWLDETAARIIKKVSEIPERNVYGPDDLSALLSSHFEDGKAVSRLFMGLSKDEFETILT